MLLPADETSRLRVFGLALRRIAEAVYGGALSQERALPLWSLVRAQLPYPIEAHRQAGVEWRREVDAMADVFERTWIDNLVDEAEQRGERRGEERGLEQGERRGEERGERRGLEQGALRTAQTLLKQVLRHRFGGIGAEVEARIDGIADVTLLQGLMDRALDVASLDDMFTAS